MCLSWCLQQVVFPTEPFSHQLPCSLQHSPILWMRVRNFQLNWWFEGSAKRWRAFKTSCIYITVPFSWQVGIMLNYIMLWIPFLFLKILQASHSKGLHSYHFSLTPPSYLLLPSFFLIPVDLVTPDYYYFWLYLKNCCKFFLEHKQTGKSILTVSAWEEQYALQCRLSALVHSVPVGWGGRGSRGDHPEVSEEVGAWAVRILNYLCGIERYLCRGREIYTQIEKEEESSEGEF
jgi:hypothetical protein